jgi:hypothetical protein
VPITVGADHPHLCPNRLHPEDHSLIGRRPDKLNPVLTYLLLENDIQSAYCGWWHVSRCPEPW